MVVPGGIGKLYSVERRLLETRFDERDAWLTVKGERQSKIFPHERDFLRSQQFIEVEGKWREANLHRNRASGILVRRTSGA
jgi:hypothetical protein